MNSTTTPDRDVGSSDSSALHERRPQDMDAKYIVQLSHELYARTGMYPGSRELHERAFEIKDEVERRVKLAADLTATVREYLALSSIDGRVAIVPAEDYERLDRYCSALEEQLDSIGLQKAQHIAGLSSPNNPVIHGLSEAKDVAL